MAKFLLFAALVCAVLAGALAKPKVEFPQQYYAKGVFSIPYFNITEPVEIWYDGVNNRNVLRYYDGLDTYITIGNTTYAITPQVDTVVCEQSDTDGEPLTTVLPDITGYQMVGNTKVNGIQVVDYRLSMTNYSETATYDMYLTQTGTPVQLYLDGVDFVFDSHPDVYIMDYGLYLPNYIDESAFAIPSICSSAKVVSREKMMSRNSAGQVFAALNKKSVADSTAEEKFKQFAQKHNKQYANQEEYLNRLSIFKNTLQLIEEHNANPKNTYTIGVNHFADMTDEEFKTLITPKVKRPANNNADAVHEISGSALPKSVDWRQKGAVTPVKDQGVCGSCYAFGSTGSLEGVNYLATGELVSLSEQQIVDCSWTDEGGQGGNQGCGGGYASSVYQWMIDNGGVATEANYPYLMQNGFCKASDHSSGVVVKGYVNVTGTEAALQDAVALKGPVAIAIDASHPPFRYYLSGVYYQPDCKNDIDDLDHEVLAVGYGTDSGSDYWLVKNSWSTHWGMDGYVMMSRNRDNNCGMATQATYPIV